MAALTPASKRALANLRAFHPPPTPWFQCPVSRRAAVLILLYADRSGALRVVLTIRAAALKSYASQAALPGGKADSARETPWATARREACEEIGLPAADAALPRGYAVEELTELPCNLAMTELCVRPCVAFLRAPGVEGEGGVRSEVGRDLLPRLDAKEVAAVFTAPFHNFLRARDELSEFDEVGRRQRVEGEWYKGSWHSWHESAWRMHQFFVPVVGRGAVVLAEQRVSGTGAKGTREDDGAPPDGSSHAAAGKASSVASSSSSSSSTLRPPLPRSFYRPAPLDQPRYRVFGMTARILVDCARVAYAEEPEFEHNSHFGDEEMIERLLAIGRLSAIRKEGEVLTREIMKKARETKI